MKAILISIKPKYVADILNGKKTIEIRKMMPKCDLPIDVYIYCTKENSLIKLHDGYGYAHDRYVCGKDYKVDDFPKMYSGYDGQGKVVAKFTLNKVEEIWWTPSKENPKDLFGKSCLTKEQIKSYLNGNIGYAWHIDNLEIFDKPKELSEFKYLKKYSNCDKCIHNKNEYCMLCRECQEILPLTRASESWRYIEI